MNVEKFKQDHVYLSGVVRRVEEVLAALKGQAEVEGLVVVVQELFGRLSVHLALEDQVLYPKLRGHADRAVCDLAARFEQQMGGLKVEFEAFKGRWPGRIAASKDPSAFAAETHKVITALKERMRREEAELYPAAERIG